MKKSADANDIAREHGPGELRRRGDEAWHKARRENGHDHDEPGLGIWDAGEDDTMPPPRGWLLGSVFCRKFISSLIGDGGVGKTALRIAQMLSLATGRPLTGEHVFQRCRPLIISLEDDKDELRRRILAARIHHQIALQDLEGWLFLSAPGGAAGKFLIGDKDKSVTIGALGARIEAAIKKHKIDIVCIDPFVKAHSVPENSNSAIDEVIQLIADIAVRHDCAFDTPHHVSKGAGDPGNADRGRGASAMKNGARLVYSVTVMSTDEAKMLGVDEAERRSLIRMDSAKVNITPPMDAAKWFRLVGVPIGNKSELYPNGDEIQTVEPWSPPDMWGDITNLIANAILTDIDEGLPDGERYSDSPTATDRAAWKVVLRHAPDANEASARKIIATWVKNGVLAKVDYQSPKRRANATGLKLIPEKRPT